MSDSGDERTEGPETLGQEKSDQVEMDASESKPASADGEAFARADPAGSAPASSSTAAPQEISQADIDALVAASGVPDGPVDDPLAATAAPAETQPFELADLGVSSPADIDAKRVTMLNDVNLRVKLQLGQTRMLVEEVLKLGEGSVVELNRLAGDPIDVLVNDRLVARGEVLVLNDSFCVRISEVLSHDPHRVTV